MFVIKESTYDAKSADEAVLLYVEDPAQLIDAFETYEKFHKMENHSVSGLLKKSKHKVCSMIYSRGDLGSDVGSPQGVTLRAGQVSRVPVDEGLLLR